MRALSGLHAQSGMRVRYRACACAIGWLSDMRVPWRVHYRLPVMRALPGMRVCYRALEHARTLLGTGACPLSGTRAIGHACARDRVRAYETEDCPRKIVEVTRRA
jgi:hypothetical protein